MPRLKDLAGKSFGRLKVIERSPLNDKHGAAVWRCLCECGNETTVRGWCLLKGHTKSCGCGMGNNNIIHGGARRSGFLLEYNSWLAMHKRCKSPTNPAYKNYGGRGITVCERWNDFANFRADMGPRPSRSHSIERIDNDAGYSPENCIWATPDVQAGNRRMPNNSGYNGVCFHKATGKYHASIWVGGKRYYLGLFKTAEEAHEAYLEAAKKYRSGEAA